MVDRKVIICIFLGLALAIAGIAMAGDETINSPSVPTTTTVTGSVTTAPNAFGNSMFVNTISSTTKDSAVIIVDPTGGTAPRVHAVMFSSTADFGGDAIINSGSTTILRVKNPLANIQYGFNLGGGYYEGSTDDNITLEVDNAAYSGTWGATVFYTEN
jgi:hypothetical protein